LVRLPGRAEQLETGLVDMEETVVLPEGVVRLRSNVDHSLNNDIGTFSSASERRLPGRSFGESSCVLLDHVLRQHRHRRFRRGTSGAVR
jgi:hypothetical protein